MSIVQIWSQKRLETNWTHFFGHREHPLYAEYDNPIASLECVESLLDQFVTKAWIYMYSTKFWCHYVCRFPNLAVNHVNKASFGRKKKSNLRKMWIMNFKYVIRWCRILIILVWSRGVWAQSFSWCLHVALIRTINVTLGQGPGVTTVVWLHWHLSFHEFDIKYFKNWKRKLNSFDLHSLFRVCRIIIAWPNWKQCLNIFHKILMSVCAEVSKFGSTL